MTVDLTTYAGLQTQIAATLNRRDLTDQIPAFIAQAEAKFNRELRVRDMQQRTDITYDGTGFAPIPAGWLSSDSLENVTGIGTYGAEFEFVSEDMARKIRRGTMQPTQPTWYTTYGSSFEIFGGGSGQLLRLRYYQALPPLATNTNNWLLLKSPDLYIAGACVEAAIYLKDDNALTARWAPVRQQILDAMQTESDRARFPQGKLIANRKSFG